MHFNVIPSNLNEAPYAAWMHLYGQVEHEEDIGEAIVSHKSERISGRLKPTTKTFDIEIDTQYKPTTKEKYAASVQVNGFRFTGEGTNSYHIRNIETTVNKLNAVVKFKLLLTGDIDILSFGFTCQIPR